MDGVDYRQKFMGSNFNSLKEYGHFYIGALTGMYDVFVVSKEFIEHKNLERDLVLPYAYRGEEINRYEDTRPIAFIIYPYEDLPNEEVRLIPIDRLRIEYPNTYSYLLEYKEKLMGRKDSRKHYANEDNWYRFLRPGKYSYIKSKKLIIKGVATKSTVGVLDSMNAFNGANCPGMILNNPSFTNYLLSILNSSLIAVFLRGVCPAKLQGYIRINVNNLNQTPICRISFTTPADRRAALVNQAKALYTHYLVSSQP